MSSDHDTAPSGLAPRPPRPPRPPLPALVPALLRFYLGVVFFVAAVPKLQPGFPATFTRFIGGVEPQAFAFYRAFLDTVVVPNAPTFAWLVRASEIVVAASLVLGLGTRLGAALAIFLMVNYAALFGAAPWTPSSNNWPLAALAAVVLVARAGRTFGVDGYLARRLPRYPLG